MHLTLWDLAVIIAYMGLLSGIGFHFSRRQKSRDEYFLGSRQMNWILVGGSIMATLVSTITYLNTTGEMIRYGIGYFANLLVVPLIVPVVNRVIIPVFARMPITSAYEYLEKRFDGGTRSLASVIFVFRSLIWGGLIIYTASFAVAEMTGWGIYVTILLMGVSTTVYTTAGGLRTVIWTDNIQLWILFGGALAIPVFVGFAIGTGPAGWWEVFSQAGHAQIRTFSWDPTVRVTAIGSMLSYFLWNVCTQGSDQVAVQRYLSTPTLEAARKSVWMYAFFKFMLTACLLVCGLALFAYYADRSGLPVQQFQQQIAPRADKVMPQFIVQVLPPGVSGLLLAALLAAAMSSLSSAINSISSVVSSDFLGRLRPKASTDALGLEKLVSLAAGVIAVTAGLGIAAALHHVDWNLVELSNRVNTVFVGPMGVFFFAGILLRRVGTKAVIAGFLVGAFMSIFSSFGKELFGLEKSISFMWVVPSGFVFGMAAAFAASYVFRPPAEERIRSLTMAGVVADAKGDRQ